MTAAGERKARPLTGAGSSREVNFYPVYRLLSPLLGDAGLIPGTPAWCQLEDTDPAKWQAILWAAVWWAVGEEIRQDAIADAGEQVWAGEDWSRVASHVQRRREIDALRRSA